MNKYDGAWMGTIVPEREMFSPVEIAVNYIQVEKGWCKESDGQAELKQGDTFAADDRETSVAGTGIADFQTCTAVCFE